jgi:hypothetical protein
MTTPIGFKVLNFGDTGVGKTHALGTLAGTGLKVRCLFTENGLDTLGRYFADRGQAIPPEFAWHYVPMAQTGWAPMIKMSEYINTLDLKGLTGLPGNMVQRDKYREFIDVLNTLANFHDDRTGEKLGGADTWGTDTVLVMDSFSGLSDAMRGLQIGLRPTMDRPDYQIIQNHLEKLLVMLSQLRCHVILTGHWSRGTDETTGKQVITLDAPGRALGASGKLGRFFSDVIISKRLAKEFFWSTVYEGAGLKTRHLTLADEIPPNYASIYNNWKKFAEAASPSTAATPAQSPAGTSK